LINPYQTKTALQKAVSTAPKPFPKLCRNKTQKRLFLKEKPLDGYTVPIELSVPNLFQMKNASKPVLRRSIYFVERKNNLSKTPRLIYSPRKSTVQTSSPVKNRIKACFDAKRSSDEAL
jgi:hypothetical protein